MHMQNNEKNAFNAFS